MDSVQSYNQVCSNPDTEAQWRLIRIFLQLNNHGNRNYDSLTARPIVKEYTNVRLSWGSGPIHSADNLQGRKFRTGDRVFVSVNRVLKGPLLVESFDSNDRTYTLREEDGNSQWEGGKRVKESDMQLEKKWIFWLSAYREPIPAEGFWTLARASTRWVGIKFWNYVKIDKLHLVWNFHQKIWIMLHNLH